MAPKSNKETKQSLEETLQDEFLKKTPFIKLPRALAKEPYISLLWRFVWKLEKIENRGGLIKNVTIEWVRFKTKMIDEED